MAIIALKKEGALQPESVTPISLQCAQMQTGLQYWTSKKYFVDSYVKIKVFLTLNQINYARFNEWLIANKRSLLTLFRPGEEGILPPATLDVNNFFNIKANAAKLGDFFRNLSGNNLI